MSADTIELPQVEIGQDGTLTMIGNLRGVATLRLDQLGFSDNALAAKKIGETFRGQCLFTEDLNTKAPLFIFTVNVGTVVNDPMWFLRMIRHKLIPMVPEIDLLSR